MQDAFRRSARSFLQAFLGILSAAVGAQLLAGQVVESQLLLNAVLSALVGAFATVLFSLGQNTAEDQGLVRPLFYNSLAHKAFTVERLPKVAAQAAAEKALQNN
jgi:hypothetical protein